MRPNPEFNPRWAGNRSQPRETVAAGEESQLDGLLRLGMKRDALRLARQLLRKRPLTASEFNDALNAILTLPDSVRPFRALADSAYKSLTPRARAKARYWMLSLLSSVRDHAAVLALTPKRFTGEFASTELIYAIEAAFETGDPALIKRLAQSLPRFVDEADHPILRAHLLLCIAESLEREGLWEDALIAAEAARTCETLHRQTIETMVEVRAVQALLAVRGGLADIKEFNQRLDPETELMVPGNDQAVQDQAATRFRSLERALERLVPRKRQQALGLTDQ